jgi:Skp family chaperone for outer membrane proteins
MLAAGVVALSGAVLLTAKLTAQPPAAAQPPAEPRTRIALLNLTYVIKNYSKFLAFQEEMKKAVENYQAQDKLVGGQIEAKTKDMQNPALQPAQKEAIQKDLTALHRKREDNSNEAKAFLGKKSDEQMVILYKEVQEAAQRYAAAHNFELVLHYNDAVSAQDYWSAPNIMRKMQAGACMPLYCMPGMDISAQIVQTLNAAYRPAAAPAQPAQTPR